MPHDRRAAGTSSTLVSIDEGALKTRMFLRVHWQDHGAAFRVLSWEPLAGISMGWGRR